MDSLEPVLELLLQVSRLNLHGGFHEPNVIVSVEISSGPHGRWIQHSQTEAIQSRRDCQFLKTISFFPNEGIDPNTKLQFSFKRLRKNDQTDVIGSAFCMVEAILANSPLKKLQLTLNGASVGYIEVKPVTISHKLQQNLVEVSTDNLHRNSDEMSCMSRNPFFKHLLIHPISRTYRVTNLQGDDIAVYEYMLETPLSFQIPLQYLEMCRSESSRAIELMEKMGNLKDELETQRISMMNKCREHLIQYKARIDSMKKYNDGSSPCIKKSADKTSEELEFVPINLHVQHMKVQHMKVQHSPKSPHNTEHMMTSSTTSDNNNTNTRTAMIPLEDGDKDDSMMKMNMNEYNFLTVGATAAHSKGFKQGGLLNLLSSDGTTRSSRKNQITEDMLNKALEYGGLSDREVITKLELEVKENCYEIHQLLDEMRKIINNPIFHTQIFILLDKISKQMGKFICCCDNSDLENAHELMTSNMRRGTILEPVTSSSQSCDHFPDTNWDELKLKVKTSLSQLVKSVDKGLSNEDGSTNDKVVELILNSIEIVENDIKELRNEAERSLFHLQFIRSSSHEYYSDLFYRRRVVFSQALSMCACGVASTMLKTAGEHTRHDIFEQYDKCGFLLQIESLLSTYGNETGMIQDYVIGVMDLRRLSVKFEMKSSTSPTTDDWQPVLLTGSTLKLVLKIFLDETSFNLLPQRLKDGGLMKIHPTFFNVGINQEQTLAEKFGDTVVQDYLNRESFQRLAEYHEKVVQMTPQTIHNYPKRYTTSSTTNEQQSQGFLPRMRSTITSQVMTSSHNTILDRTTNGKTTYEVLDKIRIALNSNKNKPVEILQLTAEVCRRLNGLRVTSCKSAKDRTAMSVTLEQASILMQEHNIDEKTFHASLSAMRSNGTRLENTMKNVGQRKYAFASVQLMTFPKLYRPPDGTYGKVES